MSARLRDIIRVLRAFDVDVEESKGGGSHWKSRRGKDGPVYPIPAGHGDKTEIDDKYIKGACRCHGISYDEFRKKL